MIKSLNLGCKIIESSLTGNESGFYFVWGKTQSDYISLGHKQGLEVWILQVKKAWIVGKMLVNQDLTSFCLFFEKEIIGHHEDEGQGEG